MGGGRGGAGLAELTVRGGALGAGAEGRGRAGAGGVQVTRADGSGPGPGAKSAPALGACWKSARAEGAGCAVDQRGRERALNRAVELDAARRG